MATADGGVSPTTALQTTSDAGDARASDTPGVAAASEMAHPFHAASVEHRAPASAIAVREVGAPVHGSDFADAFAQQVVWMADKDAQIAELRSGAAA